MDMYTATQWVYHSTVRRMLFGYKMILQENCTLPLITLDPRESQIVSLIRENYCVKRKNR